MKNVAYFFLLSIELTKDLVKCAKTETIKCRISGTNDEGTFDSSHLPCDETDLILQENDDKLFDVKILELRVNHNCVYKHLWKITSPNTFKRLAKLTQLIIQGLILLPDDIHTREKLESQLFHVPTITTFEYNDCFIENTRGKSARWVLPPNVSEITIETCDIAHFDWKKLTKLNILRMIDQKNIMEKIPELGFPSLHELDILWATQINFTIPEIAFHCNMTRFIFNADKIRRENSCKCELLKHWQQYLQTENFTLNIEVYNEEPFNDTACYAENCTDFDETLKEAKSRRASCLSLKRPPPEDAAPTVKKKEFDSKSWPFWVFIAGGFLIIALIFALFMFAAERLTKPSVPALTTPTEFIGEEELEEEEEEAEEEEE